MLRRLLVLIAALLLSLSAYATSIIYEEPKYTDIEWHEIDEQALIDTLVKREKLYEQIYEVHTQLTEGFGKEVGRRLQHTHRNGTGLRVDWESMTVDHVMRGSPAAQHGIQVGDEITEIHGLQYDGSAEALYRMQWAFVRNNVGDLLDIKTTRDGDTLHVHAEIKSKEALRAAQREAEQTELTTEQRQQYRATQISYRYRSGARDYASSGDLSTWDEVTFLCIDESLADALGIAMGATVIEIANTDHPLQLGDVVLRVGTQAPKDGQHLSELLYEFDSEAFVPLHIKRGEADLLLELPYPEGEKIR